MIRTFLMLLFILITLPVISRAQAEADGSSADPGIRLTIEEGEHYRHRIPVFLFFSVKAPPQIAIWIEDMEGNFMETLFVTQRTAQDNWRKAPGDDTQKEKLRRPESLPRWIHRSTGTEAQHWKGPLPDADAVSSATPKSGFSIPASLPEETTRFRVLAEVNASLDFNESYPKDAAKGSVGYSGGPWGSGQPALVYAAEVDMSNPGTEQIELETVGHSSPDGSTGKLCSDLSGITTAHEIVRGIYIKVHASGETK
ncbi:DUF2271 domain-containing protein [Marispirochaeta sp.]|uniref:DUF2271 domain-containing protein n=1 Tax=Marispirochaeta sp. TaxID=2038653 RepID=UPI0029C7342C|nr:DUF2271 domain-containing protein [Marispirochaeta sp.]